MTIYKLIEIWDCVACILYDFIATLKYYLYDQFKYKRMLKKNLALLDKHKGERCVIVLNGPSIQSLDLSRIEKEVVICSNLFYLSDRFDVVKPNYYCVCDSDFFKGELLNNVKEVIRESRDVKFVFNKCARDILTEQEQRECYFVYGMHMPHLLNVRGNLASMSSSFTNVALFCIIVAIYMGFKEIYIAGLDFAPGPVKHCYGNVAAHNRQNSIYTSSNMLDICTYYWCYYLAHLQSGLVAKMAKEKGVNIYNLNKDSSIRAFSFADYNDCFK